jgi:hypothetical protein
VYVRISGVLCVVVKGQGQEGLLLWGMCCQEDLMSA